jgi:hypothetical protein
MQNQGRVKENNLNKFLYPPRNEHEREASNQKSPIIAKQLSYSTNDFLNKKPNLKLYYSYENQQDSPSASSYILNKELNRNALGNAKDENQFSVLDNNYNNYSTPLSYTNKSYKAPEGRIYHYSIASRKDYSRDKEEDYNLYYYYPEQKSRKYYIERRTTPYTEKNYYHRRQGENILPTKVYTSDSYLMNKNDPYRFRPSREKDGYKGGIVNLKRNKYFTSEEINCIILIQRWWRHMLLEKRSKNESEYLYDFQTESDYQNFPSITGKRIISRGNQRITEKIIPGQNDKFIVQTTRVEVYKRPYMSKPLLKPEIISKEIKPYNIQKNNNFESNKDFEIILEKETLKQYMRNIWNEENVSTSAESLNIIQNESQNENVSLRMKKITINEYEEQIKQLKIDLSIKEKALIEANNKLKSLPNKRILEK